MFARCCVALLALSFSLTAAAEPDCDELTKPVEDRSKLLGKWIWFAATSDCDDLLKELKTVNSSWIELISTSETGDMLLRYGDRAGGKCYFGSANATFDGNITTSTFHYNNTTRVHFGKHLQTCPDCILWDDLVNKSDGRVCRSIYFFSKTGKVGDADQEVFRKQRECLNYTTELYTIDNPDLCLDEVAADAKKEEQ